MSELPELVLALLKPDAYPEPVTRIELMQTQMSFIFITGDFVYKVKKPVNLGYLDYTTLPQREFFCSKEVELNRRLCPQTYLSVLPVTKYEQKITVNGQGEVIDYAVKMRYLPQQFMMNVLIGQDMVTAEMVERVAAKMADFHNTAATGPDIIKFGLPEAIKINTDENFNQTEKYFGKTISAAKFSRIKQYTVNFLKDQAEFFMQRATGGRVRDCHGDLHAAHVCFTDGICIYDCIEFNDRFRYCDVASEIAFLAMDLDHYGRADLSRIFTEAYVDHSKDSGLAALLNFYKCYRAYVRGKVESFKLDDSYIGDEEKKRVQTVASGYFDLADSYTRVKPLLIITVGLVGTGKSTAARALAKRLGTEVIVSDVTRKKLAGMASKDRYLADYNAGIYTQEFSRRTYDAIFDEAGKLLAKNRSVILDASFIKAEERLKAKEIAAAAGADFYIIECTLAEDEIKKRLSRRLELGSISDGRWEIYLPQKQRFEAVREVTEDRHIIIDTFTGADNYIAGVVDKLTRSN